MAKISSLITLPGIGTIDPGTLPPLHSDTITVTSSIDLRGTAQFDKSNIVFAGTDFARLQLSSIQFGNGNISETVSVTGDSFRNFIDVFLTNGDTTFSAAGWTFDNFIPYNPLQHDQVTIYGSAAADTITGSSVADGLIGGDGNDTLMGLDGRDILIGGLGLDTLIGGDGDDQYRLESVHLTSRVPIRGVYDTVIEEADGGIDTVLITPQGLRASAYTLTENVENAFIQGTGTFTLNGNSLANAMTGNNDANVLNGLDGADTLRGLGGDDTLEGGRGGDVVDGGDGIDTASYSGARAAVTVSLAITGAQATLGAGTDTLIGIENLRGSAFDDALTGNAQANRLEGGNGNDDLTGGEGDDVLLGGNDRDRLIGNAGEDVLDGGFGNDVLNGGGSSDRFVFGPGTGDDTIVNFVDNGGLNDDVIDLTHYGFGSVDEIGMVASGADLVLRFGGGDTARLLNYLDNHSIADINDDIILV